jgi:peptide/nickel transport system substrate-binding protein
MLAAAGYPNGYTASIMVLNQPSEVDFASAIKSMWSKVGVTLDIQAKESGVYNSTKASFSYDDMVLGQSPPAANYVADLTSWSKGLASTWNLSRVGFGGTPEEDTLAKGVADASSFVFTDENKVQQMIHDLTPFFLEQAYYVPRPAIYNFVFWEPWIKNYHGELSVNAGSSDVSFLPWVWVDQPMKKAAK